MATTESASYIPPGVSIPDEEPGPFAPSGLLADASGSMGSRNRITEVNEGLTTLCTELRSDELARNRADVFIVEIKSEAREVLAPTLGRDLVAPPQLTAGGLTAIGSAMRIGLATIDGRRREYRDRGVKAYVPFLFLLTDGQPTDTWHAVAKEIHSRQAAGRMQWFVIGTTDADDAGLKALAGPHRPAMRVRDGEIPTLFRWISDSLKNVSGSTPGTSVPLPPTDGWGQVVA